VAQRPDPGVTRYQNTAGELRWRVTYDLPPGPDGERRRTTKRGFATVKDANRFRRDALARHEQGLGRDPAQGRQRLADYLRAWLEGLSVKATSRADYRQSIECYIAPRIGGIRLEQLTPSTSTGSTAASRPTASAAGLAAPTVGAVRSTGAPPTCTRG
jgi:hypothetical protein